MNDIKELEKLVDDFISIGCMREAAVVKNAVIEIDRLRDELKKAQMILQTRDEERVK